MFVGLIPYLEEAVSCVGSICISEVERSKPRRSARQPGILNVAASQQGSPSMFVILLAVEHVHSDPCRYEKDGV